MKNRRFIVCLVLLVVLPTHLFAQLDFSSGTKLPLSAPVFPENHHVRRQLEDTIFAANHELTTMREQVIEQELYEPRVLFRIERTDAHYYFLFTNEYDYKFPLFSRGSYIIKRDRNTGEFIQVKIFFQTNPGCFVRIFPYEERSRMNVFYLNRPVYQHITLPFSFRQILFSSFSQIIDVTRNRIEWDIMWPPETPHEYHDIITMVEKIRENLPSLPDAEDGAMNKDGEFVFIATEEKQEIGGFNCSGFTKWIADGIQKSRTGSYLEIRDLKEKHTSFRGNRWSRQYEVSHDPYFGLDWTRNIAMKLEQHSKREEIVTPESVDIRNVPFFDYIEDVGYELEELELILYLLSGTRPNTFYLGSINGVERGGVGLRKHFHVVALFPYVDNDGTFTVAVFERNRETDIESLIKRYSGKYIHLVGIQAGKQFELPSVPPAGQ